MKKLIAFIMLLFPVLGIGQTTTENYVKTTSYQVATQTGSVSEDHKIENISYYDGLGRAKQSVSAKAGGDKQNIVQLVTYDSLGRTNKQYLPFATSAEIPNPLDFTNQGTLQSNIEAFYNTAKYENTLNPYSETLIENAPLNRPLRQGAPGNSWKIQKDNFADHTIHYVYTSNTVSDGNTQGDDVLDFEVVFSGTDITLPSLQLVGLHPANNLSRTITQDENFEQLLDPSGPTNPSDAPLQAYQIIETGAHASEEFVNKKGQTVLKRTYNNDVVHDTYYVYDDFGNLTFVLSPEASAQIVSGTTLVANAQDILNRLAYQYKYDYRNRLIEKKVPAKGWEYILYDKLDRPVLTQDANLRQNNEYLFTKYDDFNRVVYTGIYTSGSSRQTIQNQIDAQTEFNEDVTINSNSFNGNTLYYTNQVFPINSISVLTINYYDTYKDLGSYSLPTTAYGQTITNATKGLPTVSKVRVLATSNWITTATGYDVKARPIFSYSENTYLGTTDTSESLLDFTGKVLESRTTHQKTGHQAVVTKDYFTYDHQNRLITQMQQIDDEPLQLIASNTYDNLGQLESKRVGGQLFEVGYTDLVNVVVSDDGHLITKLDDPNLPDAYNAGLATIGKLEGDGGISFSVESIGSELRVGFNDINTEEGVYDINYFYRFLTTLVNGKYKYIIYKRPLAGGGAQSLYTGYYDIVSNDFKIERDGDTLYFIQNGAVVTSTLLEDPSISLIGDISLKTPNSQISSLNFYATNIDKSLQKVDYQYNVRGWLTDINDINSNSGERDLFNFHINYDTKEGMTSTGSVTPLYNGNISQTIWKSANSDSQVRAYGYAYDDLNRINGGFSRKGINYNTVDSYTLFNVNYDRNGNIETLKRNGYIPTSPGYQLMDDLSYAYNGNQLLNVIEGSTSGIKKQGFYDGNTSATLDDYEYDVNGNMIKDRNKGITDNIEYNHLNLPVTVRINTVDAQGDTQQGTISYIYDATGIKLAKIMNDEVQNSTITTYYAGGYIYENNNNNVESLKMFPHPEGYIEPVYGTSKSIGKFSTQTQTASFSNYQYAFNYTDHLGNVRLTYADSDGDGAIEIGTEIISEKHYYPFGLKQKGYNDVVSGNVNHTADRFSFQGQELQEDLGLGWLQFKWRNHDPAIGRFFNLDPLAEKFVYNSPYAFSENKVISHFELEGLEAVLGITLGKDVKYRGDILEQAHPGTQNINIQSGGVNSFVDAFRTASASDPEGIAFVAVWGHGYAGTIFGAQADASVSNSGLSKLNDAIKNGEVNFTDNALIYLGNCNSATCASDDVRSFAAELSKITGATVIGGNASVGVGREGSQIENAESMIYWMYNPNKDNFVSFNDGVSTNLGGSIDVIRLLNRTMNPPTSVGTVTREGITPSSTPLPTGNTLQADASSGRIDTGDFNTEPFRPRIDKH
ncbi:DUF6443 domain-containing protein [Dokdonia ponticola]|uniref:DUF6443 domain-containing protein n=1 Tax=Dokdonia ponticola TaxID=2041041 RepID=A0ABV9HY12_9FLAO